MDIGAPLPDALRILLTTSKSVKTVDTFHISDFISGNGF